jgi:hypothetical protein
MKYIRDICLIDLALERKEQALNKAAGNENSSENLTFEDLTLDSCSIAILVALTLLDNLVTSTAVDSISSTENEMLITRLDNSNSVS